MTYDNTRIAWIDVETTGVELDATLLSVACIVTDADLNELSAEPYQAVVYFDALQAQELRDNAVPFVQNMHDKTGLWEELPDGKSLKEIDRNLFAFIREYAPSPRQARLGGNSVRLDLNMLQANLPTSYAHLHYRMFDMTTLTTAAQWWGNVEPMEKATTHEALSDIRESIAEARYIKSQVFDKLT